MKKSPILYVLENDKNHPTSVEERLQAANEMMNKFQMILEHNSNQAARMLNCRKRGNSIKSYFPRGDEIFADGFTYDEEGHKHHEYVPEVYLKLKTVDAPNSDNGYSDAEIKKYFKITSTEWNYFKQTYFPDWTDEKAREAYLQYGGEKARKWYKKWNEEDKLLVDVQVTAQGRVIFSRNFVKHSAKM